MMKRRVLLAVLVFAVSVFAVHADDRYPSRTVTVIVPQASGGANDAIARVIAQKLSALMNRQFLVDNRPGAGGNIGTSLVAKARPDGYTLLLTANSMLVINPALYRSPGFDPVKDFEPVALVATAGFVIVAHPGFPANSIKELIALSQAKPLTYAGSSGIGGTVHLGMEGLAKFSGMKLRIVPYKGSAPAYLGLLGGEVQLVCGSVMSATTLIRNGKVRGIASLGTKRALTLPDLPTAIEQGLPEGFRIDNRYNLWVRAGTPRSIINAINRAAGEGIRSPEMAKRLSADGSEPAPHRTPEELRADLTHLAKGIDAQVKELGIKF